MADLLWAWVFGKLIGTGNLLFCVDSAGGIVFWIVRIVAQLIPKHSFEFWEGSEHCKILKKLRYSFILSWKFARLSDPKQECTGRIQSRRRLPRREAPRTWTKSRRCHSTTESLSSFFCGVSKDVLLRWFCLKRNIYSFKSLFLGGSTVVVYVRTYI